MNAVNAQLVSQHLDKLDFKPQAGRQTAVSVVAQLAGKIERLTSEGGWTVLEVMREISEAANHSYSPYTLKNAWFKYQREIRGANHHE